MLWVHHIEERDLLHGKWFYLWSHKGIVAGLRKLHGNVIKGLNVDTNWKFEITTRISQLKNSPRIINFNIFRFDTYA